jgi:hypothetical protein
MLVATGRIGRQQSGPHPSGMLPPASAGPPGRLLERDKTMKRKLLGIAMTISCTLASALVAATPASAAAGCWHSNSRWWCQNRYGAGVYDLSWDGTTYLVGHMYSTTSWFDCRDETTPAWVGGPHPYRWVFTKADNGEVGWMKDSDIISETNPLPVCMPT